MRSLVGKDGDAMQCNAMQCNAMQQRRDTVGNSVKHNIVLWSHEFYLSAIIGPGLCV